MRSSSKRYWTKCQVQFLSLDNPHGRETAAAHHLESLAAVLVTCAANARRIVPVDAHDVAGGFFYDLGRVPVLFSFSHEQLRLSNYPRLNCPQDADQHQHEGNHHNGVVVHVGGLSLPGEEPMALLAKQSLLDHGPIGIVTACSVSFVGVKQMTRLLSQPAS